MKKKKRVKRRYTRLIDLILNMIFILVCAFTIYKCHALEMLPMQWLLLGIVATLIVILIFLVLMFFNMPKWGLAIKRIILIALCIGIGFGGYSLGNVTKAITEVSISETSATIKVRVLTRKNSGITSLNQVSTSNIGVQVGTDKTNTLFGQQELEKAVGKNLNYQEEVDYTTLTTEFMMEMLDCILISDDYLAMMNTNVEGFKDSYTELAAYEHARPINPSDKKDISKESFTLLISGVDNVGASDQVSLSDVNILLFVNPVSNQITMISLPRDSFMPHHALNNINDKLTHTGSYGIEDTMLTIENFFNIDIDYFAKVSFTSLIEIVDSIDGIDVDVEIDFEEQDENRSFDDGDLIVLKKGNQHLNGRQALAYARHRKTEGYDVAGRERAQERIIKAVIDKLLTAQGVALYANRLMETVPKYVVTNMPGKQITSFIKGELKDIKPWGIQSLTVENGLYDLRPVPNLALPQSTYLWNQYDYRHVLDAYESSKENLNFSDFNFDLADLSKYLPQLKQNPNLVWDTMAIDPY